MQKKHGLTGGDESGRRPKAKKQSKKAGSSSNPRPIVGDEAMVADNLNITQPSLVHDSDTELFPGSDDNSLAAMGSDIDTTNELTAAALNEAFPDMIDGWATSDYWGDLPGVNPFWQVMTAEDPLRVKKFRYDFANTPTKNRKPPPLTLMGDGRLKENVRHLDVAIRAYAARVFFRNLRIDDSDIGDRILLERFGVDTALAEGWRKKIMGWQSEWQGQMLGWMLTSVTLLTELVGTPELWKSSTVPQRHELFSTYYNCDPKFTAYLLFKATHTAIDFHGIFANADPNRAKWQKYVENIFCWTAEDTYYLRIRLAGPVNPTNTITVMASNFRQLAWSKYMVYLNLGDLDQIPISKTGVFDTLKRAKLLPPIIHGGERVLAR